ncbi:fimbrial protein [Pseudaminobacter sp. 19-2017]|uniref:Fimbrial protein n=1 Tax=Pseudaminobacter soli (ex Zhang et al. 2022) TaxID=2831468 RepID=A0A942I778_9HYPH|nr:fimbrial protein [Pseudaminobacter soli]MBS3648110.1 fimbrial protein [Pseudaminobacter soli]
MARPTFEDEEDKPLDPAVENVRKKLVRFVAINLGILLVALMAVVGAIVYKTRSAAPPAAELPISEIPVPPGAVLEGEIPLPAGARIVSQSLSGNRLALEIELTSGGRAIHVYDIAERRVVARFSVVAQ